MPIGAADTRSVNACASTAVEGRGRSRSAGDRRDRARRLQGRPAETDRWSIMPQSGVQAARRGARMGRFGSAGDTGCRVQAVEWRQSACFGIGNLSGRPTQQIPRLAGGAFVRCPLPGLPGAGGNIPAGRRRTTTPADVARGAAASPRSSGRCVTVWLDVGASKKSRPAVGGF